MEQRLVSRLALARELGVEAQTIAKWERQGWFPKPNLILSDRLILYHRHAVDEALRERHRKSASSRLDLAGVSIVATTSKKAGK